MRSNSSLKASLFAFVFASAMSVGCGPAVQDEEGLSSSDDASLTAQWEDKKHDDGNDNKKHGKDKVAICHVPPSHDFVLFVPVSALGGHLGHGDCLCENNKNDKHVSWNNQDNNEGNCGNNPKKGDPCSCDNNNNKND